MKRVFIIHGWGGNPDEPWLKWLKQQLEAKDYEATNPKMPNTWNPKISEWVNRLNQSVGEPNEDTYFVGHSIGCQAIMRYLEQLPENQKVGGVIFVAGWFNLTDETWDEIYTKKIAKEWVHGTINFSKIKKHTDKFLDIASDDDPYVPLSDTELFKNNLGAKIIVVKRMGHIAGDNGVNELPVVLEELLKMME
ncbi:MAG: hypothetical protein UT43_C0037G0003 [Parcubacteria group bacterium GW2011_GWC1_39_29]|uniref:Serine hydrolase family protein n=1 Tax=Candidatus Yanofskybacteria bacterium GW2011_GWD1_39_16 TaxID=1619030 RepID=A0A837HTT7_9BACT|nr:MAG: hypothetical protein UT35_C0031G0003 [Candidatus Yanofskybacteria bacterium GW2011_GWD1_39_16]KKR13678.1 MAG: hypothetical protein UT43_C0037G0003 [Parcubacteria group bacterium GW2011_GWC1_39_29]